MHSGNQQEYPREARFERWPADCINGRSCCMTIHTGESSPEPDLEVQSPASGAEICVAGDTRPVECVDSLLLFPSEGTGDGNPDPSNPWTYPANVPSAKTTWLNKPSGGAAQKITVTRESISLEGHLDALAELYDLCLGIDERLARAEQALRRAEDPVAARHFLDQFTRLDERLTQTERLLQTLQAAVPGIDKTIHELHASIATGFDRTQEALRQTESRGAGTEQLAASIDTRLADTTEKVSRIERLVGGGSLPELAAARDARQIQIEETLGRIERVSGEGSAGSADEGNQRKSPEAGVLRHQPTSPWMAASKSMRVSQHWIAAMPRVDVSRVIRRFAAAVVLMCVLAVVTMRVDDPRPGLQGNGVDGGQKIAASTISATVPSVIVPAVEAAPLMTKTIQPAASKRPVAAVTRPLQKAVIPDPPKTTAPEEPAPRQDAASAPFVGTLEVTSNPAGAQVSVNGRPVGVTPLTLSKHRAGSLALQVTREGYERWSASIQVQTNRVTQVTATLRPRP
jgi:hypothetical protein